MKDVLLATPVAMRWPEEPTRLVAAETDCPRPAGWRRLWQGVYRFLYDFNRY